MLESILNIRINKDNPKYWIIEFIGNLDSYGLAERRKEILEAVNAFDKQFLIFDFTALEYINSESIGLMLQINETLLGKNQQLVLIRAKKNVIDVLEVIGLLETVSYYKDLDEFLSKKLTNVN